MSQQESNPRPVAYQFRISSAQQLLVINRNTYKSIWFHRNSFVTAFTELVLIRTVVSYPVVVIERLPFGKEISVKNFWQMVPDLKTSQKREIGKSCIICKTPDNEWAWVKTNHLPPQKEAWHWLTRQTVQIISVVSVKTENVWYLERYYFFPENFYRDKPYHLNSPRYYRLFHTNGKRSLS